MRAIPGGLIALFLLTLGGLPFGPIACAAAAALPLSGRVMDHASLLSADSEARLTQSLAAHEAATSNQVVVITLPELGGYAIEEKALEFARDWKLGVDDRDNGALLLIAAAERGIRIEVGYGLEGALTDAIAANIIRTQMQPSFRSGNFDQGVEAGVAAMLAAIAGEYEARPVEEQSGMEKIIIAVIIIISLWQFLGPRSGRRRGRGMIMGPGGFGSGGFGGGGGGGGGFSGGGGGFGGGGASGGW